MPEQLCPSCRCDLMCCDEDGFPDCASTYECNDCGITFCSDCGDPKLLLCDDCKRQHERDAEEYAEHLEAQA